MRILVVGNGGREHALAWKLAASEQATAVFVAPGNGGTALESNLANVAIAADDIDGLIDFASTQGIDLTVVGPEQPLVAGIVDRFSEAGLTCLGPKRAAAALEGSKAFAKAFMQRHGIPTADYAEFDALEPALKYLESAPIPIVVKADGLAAGKGVVVAQTRESAINAARAMLADSQFGAAGQRIVIEEFLEGEEASFIVLTDGQNCLPMASSQDHKARYDGDQGPNTGGMGAYSPAPIVTPERFEQIMAEVIAPTLDGLRQEQLDYAGFLYAGLMISPDGELKVLEFNCRFGDPETQPIMSRLQSDFAELCLAAATGALADLSIDWDADAALGVVIAAGDYPMGSAKGDAITGIDVAESHGTKVFHAGTTLTEDTLVTAGGRVLCVVGKGASVKAARDKAYQGVKAINWTACDSRSDIGYRAIAREAE